jgi:hypothetical protein
MTLSDLVVSSLAAESVMAFWWSLSSVSSAFLTLLSSSILASSSLAYWATFSSCSDSLIFYKLAFEMSLIFSVSSWTLFWASNLLFTSSIWSALVCPGFGSAAVGVVSSRSLPVIYWTLPPTVWNTIVMRSTSDLAWLKMVFLCWFNCCCLAASCCLTSSSLIDSNWPWISKKYDS